jgi:hypothetical protein
MDYHRFNIGKPEAGDMNVWWAENIERGVITTGFEGDPRDKGGTSGITISPPGSLPDAQARH